MRTSIPRPSLVGLSYCSSCPLLTEYKARAFSIKEMGIYHRNLRDLKSRCSDVILRVCHHMSPSSRDQVSSFARTTWSFYH
ncbi:hypothetical protein CMV_017631 [Castanea mollissima]|uniref:Uncharacterized protein n=1 Tax=Castanea mollissima TaxID=60419 RepID=A0A8J4R360_9ROSI|nr:hypothetical protein CMV_017631 [Castanea mollissima]